MTGGDKRPKTAGWAEVSAVALLLLLTAGCWSVRIDSPGDKVAKPLVDEWFCMTVWGGYWWGTSPEERCDAVWAADEGKVPTDGYRRVAVSGGWWSVPAGVLSLGMAVPVHVECHAAAPDGEIRPGESPIDL